MSGILVVGSVNADIILHLDRLPHVGETIAASNDSGQMVPGGKGANQAVAAAKLGASTAFAGRFGRDAHASTLRAVMQSHHVDISLSEDAAPGTPSGQAFILLQRGGENSIIIVGGANATWAPELPAALVAGVKQASIILLQREVPDHVNIAVARVAHAKGIPVVLDVGGRADPFPAELLPLISIISPNESELARCLGLESIGDSESDIEAAARLLQQRTHVGNVLVKLGARGSMWVPAADTAACDWLHESAGVIRQSALPPHAPIVDTTGAGDCFTAAFSVGLLSNWTVARCMRFASAAAVLCIQRLGAIPSMPSRAEVDAYLDQLDAATQ